MGFYLSKSDSDAFLSKYSDKSKEIQDSSVITDMSFVLYLMKTDENHKGLLGQSFDAVQSVKLDMTDYEQGYTRRLTANGKGIRVSDALTVVKKKFFEHGYPDYKGRDIDYGDVIAIINNDNNTKMAYYIDDPLFRRMPKFFTHRHKGDKDKSVSTPVKSAVDKSALVKIRAAAKSRLVRDGKEVWVFLTAKDSVCLGVASRYKKPAYDNSDKSLVKISSNYKMFDFLSANKAYAESQQKCLESKLLDLADYKEYDKVCKGCKNNGYAVVKELQFGGKDFDPDFVPELKVRQTHKTVNKKAAPVELKRLPVPEKVYIDKAYSARVQKFTSEFLHKDSEDVQLIKQDLDITNLQTYKKCRLKPSTVLYLCIPQKGTVVINKLFAPVAVQSALWGHTYFTPQELQDITLLAKTNQEYVALASNIKKAIQCGYAVAIDERIPIVIAGPCGELQAMPVQLCSALFEFVQQSAESSEVKTAPITLESLAARRKKKATLGWTAIRPQALQFSSRFVPCESDKLSQKKVEVTTVVGKRVSVTTNERDGIPHGYGDFVVHAGNLGYYVFNGLAYKRLFDNKIGWQQVYYPKDANIMPMTKETLPVL